MTVLTWSDDRVEQLKKLWENGLSASQIAAELGNVTRNAVIGKVHRLGLSGRATPSQPQRPTFKTPRAPHRSARKQSTSARSCTHSTVWHFPDALFTSAMNSNTAFNPAE